MTIKIQAYQAKGIKTAHIVDKYEFCCWDALHKWLDGFHSLHSCPKCNRVDVLRQNIVGDEDDK